MANTKISDLGDEIALSAKGQVRIAALGNGIAKPGERVGITDATGKVVGIDIGSSEMYLGILDKGYKTDIDTAIPDGQPCSIIIPIVGQTYRQWCTDPTGAVVSGLPHIFSATAGNIVGAAATNMNTAGVKCINKKALANTDRVGEFLEV